MKKWPQTETRSQTSTFTLCIYRYAGKWSPKKWSPENWSPGNSETKNFVECWVVINLWKPKTRQQTQKSETNSKHGNRKTHPNIPHTHHTMLDAHPKIFRFWVPRRPIFRGPFFSGTIFSRTIFLGDHFSGIRIYRILIYHIYHTSMVLLILFMCRKFWTFMWTKLIKKIYFFLEGFFFLQAVKNEVLRKKVLFYLILFWILIFSM